MENKSVREAQENQAQDPRWERDEESISRITKRRGREQMGVMQLRSEHTWEFTRQRQRFPDGRTSLFLRHKPHLFHPEQNLA